MTSIGTTNPQIVPFSVDSQQLQSVVVSDINRVSKLIPLGLQFKFSIDPHSVVFVPSTYSNHHYWHRSD